MRATPVTDDTFKSEVLESKVPVLLDFWAPWCGPCQMISPILDEIAAEMPDSIKVVKMNVDENAQVPAEFGVRTIPTLLLIRGGEVVSTKMGPLSKMKIREWIETELG